jgi:hypothetical protein
MRPPAVAKKCPVHPPLGDAEPWSFGGSQATIAGPWGLISEALTFLCVLLTNVHSSIYFVPRNIMTDPDHLPVHHGKQTLQRYSEDQ